MNMHREQKVNFSFVVKMANSRYNAIICTMRKRDERAEENFKKKLAEYQRNGILLLCMKSVYYRKKGPTLK